MVAGQDMQNTYPGGSNRSQESVVVMEDGAATEGQQKGLNLSPLLRLLQRNVLLIAGVTALVAGAQAAFVIPTSKPGYEGKFQILVEPITSQNRAIDPSILSRANPGGVEQNTIDYTTLLQVLQSPEVLNKIASEIQKSPAGKGMSGELFQTFIRVKVLEIKQPASESGAPSKVIEVAFKGTSEAQVKFVLNGLKDGYLRYSLEDRKTRIGGGVKFIEDQLPELQKRVNTLASQLQSLRQRYRLTDPVAESASMSQQAREVRTQRLDAERLLQEQQILYGRLQGQLGLTPGEAIAASALSENPRYQEVLLQLKRVEAQVAVKAARFNEESPVLRSLIDQQNNLNRLIQEEARRNLGAQYAGDITSNPRVLAFQNSVRLALINQMVTTANSAQALQARKDAIIKTEVALDQRLRSFPAIIRQYNDLTQGLEIATRTLNQFQTQRETLRIEAAQKEVPWEVIAPPSVVRSSGSLPKKLAMGVVGGLVLALITAFLRERSKNVFFSKEDLKDAIQQPLLGAVPFKDTLGQSANLLELASSDPFTKAFTSLYTSLRFLVSSASTKAIAITSAVAGDGKTTVAMHLAQAAAMMGQRVLLVDANLRTPHLHALLGVSNTKGLSELLLGKIDPEAAIQPLNLDIPVSILPAGQPSASAIRILASGEAQGVLKQLTDSYDLVLYDSPNLSEFADTAFLATQTDGLLVVASIGSTDCGVFREVMDELGQFRLPVLGVVANHRAKTIAASYNQSRQDQIQSRQDQTMEEPSSSVLENLKVMKRSV